MTEAIDTRPWYRQLNGYHWYVFALSAMGWLFDTMDGMIFTISRSKVMSELIQPAFDATKLDPEALKAATAALSQERTYAAGYVTALFLVGWATGGLIFGVVGDRWGRAKTMALTIFIYAFFTGMSGLAQNWWQFGILRFLTGIGVGGEFAAGAALIAEVMPAGARTQALGMLQSLSAVGNMLGAVVFWYMPAAWGWRYLFAVGAFPALLAVWVRTGLKEPEKWVAAKAAREQAGAASSEKSMGSMSELFTDPVWRKNVIVGMCVAISGVIGLWGAGFWSADLIDKTFDSKMLSDPERIKLKSVGVILQQIGAFCGMFLFSVSATRLGRRPTFLIAFIIAWISVFVTYYTLKTPDQVYYLWPLLGFGTLCPYGGFALYLPELFPTRLRTTGTGLCYNVGRYIAAIAPLALASFASHFEQNPLGISGFRFAAILVASSYFVGMIALIWAPETKGKPLPE